MWVKYLEKSTACAFNQFIFFTVQGLKVQQQLKTQFHYVTTFGAESENPLGARKITSSL